jgi:hypothetical protein
MRQFPLSHPDVHKPRFKLPAEVRFDPTEAFRILRAVAERKLDAEHVLARFLLHQN